MKEIKIRIESVNTCFGLGAKFWKDGSFTETDRKHILDEMHRLTEYYKNTCGANVVFVTE